MWWGLAFGKVKWVDSSLGFDGVWYLVYVC